MMVTGLQLPSNSLPLDGMLAKSRSTDSETSDSLSFGQILKVREKQLQQEQGVSASSVAAALAALQTQPIVIPMPVPAVVETSDGAAKADTQTSPQVQGSQQVTAPIGQVQAGTQVATPTPVAGRSQPAANTVETARSTAPTQPVTERSSTTASPVTPSDASPTVQAGKALQPSALPVEALDVPPVQSAPVDVPRSAARHSEKTEATASLTDTEPFGTVVKMTSQPAIKAEVTPVELKRSTPEIPSDRVPTQTGQPVPAATGSTVNVSKFSAVAMDAAEIETASQTGKVLPSPASGVEVPDTTPVQPFTARVATGQKMNALTETESQTENVGAQAVVNAEIFTKEFTPAQDEMNPGIPVIETKTVESQPGKAASPIPAAVPQDAASPRENAEAYAVQTPLSEMSGTDAHQEIRPGAAQAVIQTEIIDVPPVQDLPEIVPSKTAPTSEGTVIDMKQVEVQKETAAVVATDTAVVDVKKTTSHANMDAHAAGTTRSAVEFSTVAKHLPATPVNQEAGKPETQTIVSSVEARTSTERQPTFDTAPVQAVVQQENSSVESKRDVPQAGISASLAETSQFAAVATVITETGLDGEAEKVIAQSAEQMPVSKPAVVSDVAEPQPDQSGNIQEKPITQNKSVETQRSVDSPTIAFPQENVDTVGKAETITTTDADLEISDLDMTSVGSKEKPGNDRAASSPKAETIINEEPLPVSSARNNEIPVSLQPGVSAKVEAAQQDPEAGQTISMDEEILPVEKQQQSDPGFEAMAVTTHQVKETAAVSSPGKESPIQIDPQAAEVVRQVVHQMNIKLKSGPTSMHLQLNPKELGAIDIEMVSNSQGVRVTFFAEQASTGRLLETQLNQLRESLIDSGVQLSGLNIGQHGQPGQKGEFFNQNTNFAQHFQRGNSQSEANLKETPPTERITRQSSEVDYLI